MLSGRLAAIGRIQRRDETQYKTSRHDEPTELHAIQRDECVIQVRSGVAKCLKVSHSVASDRTQAEIRSVHRRPMLGRRPAPISRIERATVDM